MVDVSTFEDPIYEISYAATLTRSMCRSTYRVRGSDRCEFYYYAAIQLYANYAEGLHFSAFHYPWKDRYA